MERASILTTCGPIHSWWALGKHAPLSCNPSKSVSYFAWVYLVSALSHKTDKSKMSHWLFGWRVLTDEKSGQKLLRSIFYTTHHFVLLCLDFLAVWMAYVRKRCGGKFGQSVLVDYSPKLIFGTLRYSYTLTTNQLCQHEFETSKVKIMVTTRRGPLVSTVRLISIKGHTIK